MDGDKDPVFKWLGTAGFEVRFGGRVILIDPYLSRPPRARPVLDLEPRDMAGADYIFVTHGHFDHIADVPAIVEYSGAEVYCSAVSADTLAKKGVPALKLNRLSGGEKLDLGDLRVRVETCKHIVFDARLVLGTLPRILKEPGVLRHTSGMPAGPVLIFSFEFGDLEVTHMGSLGLTPDQLRTRDIPRPDVLMLPLQGHTDICSMAAALTAAIRPRAVVPQHQDDFFPPVSQMVNIEPFRRMVAERIPGCAFYEPVIGVEFGTTEIFGRGA
jgi:L-ascorbate metabolism protein UlaG (beta-lactamase superfamily)